VKTQPAINEEITTYFRPYKQNFRGTFEFCPTGGKQRVCVLGGLGPCSGGGGGGGCSSKLPMAATIPTESAHHGGTSTS
jgi:hypothetical protein